MTHTGEGWGRGDMKSENLIYALAVANFYLYNFFIGPIGLSDYFSMFLNENHERKWNNFYNFVHFKRQILQLRLTRRQN